MGAVMGYSEQHTLLLMTTDEEVEAFLNVRWCSCVASLHGRQLHAASCSVGSSRGVRRSRAVQQRRWTAPCHSTVRVLLPRTAHLSRRTSAR
jgi:hypothetical protein